MVLVIPKIRKSEHSPLKSNGVPSSIGASHSGHHPVELSFGTMNHGTMVKDTAFVVDQLQREWDSAAHSFAMQYFV
jgi:hypothetical protein